MTNRWLLFVSLLVVLASPKALACSCGGIPTARELLTRAPVVFEGVVIRKTPRLARSDFGWFVGEEWTFRVVNAWKGVTSSTVTVTEGFGNCSNIYQLGELAIVFAFPHQASADKLQTSKCASPVQPIEQQRIQLGRPSASFPLQPFNNEGGVERNVRHARVYLLAGVAATNNAVRFPTRWQHSRFAYAAAVLLGVASVGVLLLLIPGARRRFLAKALCILALLIIITVFAAGWRTIGSSGYFLHLVERECLPC